MARGPLIILSGPGGSGKSTVISRLLAAGDLPLRLSVSVTTRAPRPGEKDGVHYFFWDRPRFDREVAAGGFLEWAEVYGHGYGTLKREVEPYREQGIGVILDIDVQGWEQVRRRCPDAVSVFLRTSSLETYQKRLEARGTETPDSLKKRMAGARVELARAAEYDYQVINDDLDTAVQQFRNIVAGLLV